MIGRDAAWFTPPDDPHIYEWAETLRDITNENLKDMEDAA
jgi:hypothetical protein|nr:MAG TPA: hypothetical protein [Caudoviricetes sp.]